MALKVIDVSYYNQIIDWEKVKKSVDAVIIRLGYRGCTSGKIVIDKKAEEYIKACQDHGIPYSIYFFPTSITEQEAREEAQWVLTQIDRLHIESCLPIYADSEKVTGTGRSDNISKGLRTKCLNAFMSVIRDAGYRYGVYASTYWYKDCLNDADLLQGCSRWVAQYASKCTYTGKIDMWQYTSKASISGVKGNCDASHLYTGLLDNQTVLQEPDTNAEIIEKAVKWMEDTAADAAHGYDQRYRWGEKGDYDCSSAVITAWQFAGVPVKSAGATYTGNMLGAFRKCGFVDVTSKIDLKTGEGLLRGDVLLNTTHHTAMYVGGGKEVEASINEMGKVTGGKPGDQTGKEFLVRTYRNYPWDRVLRFQGDAAAADFRTPSKEEKFRGVVNTESSPLNVRKGPGTEYSKCQTFGPLAKGTEVSVCDTCTAADGSAWHYICYRGAKYGFVSSKYIKEA